MELSSFIFWHHWDVISCMHKWNSLVKHFLTKSGALSMIFVYFFHPPARFFFCLFVFFFFFVLESAFTNLTLWVRQSTSTPKVQTLLTQDFKVVNYWNYCKNYMDNVCIVSAMPVSQTNSMLSLILDMNTFFQKEILTIHCKVFILGLIFVWDMFAGLDTSIVAMWYKKKEIWSLLLCRSGTYINSGLCKICI